MIEDMEFVPVVIKTINDEEIFALIDNNRYPDELLEDEDAMDLFADVHLFVPIVCKRIFHYNALTSSYEKKIAYYSYLEHVESDNVAILLENVVFIEPMKMGTYHIYSNLIPKYYLEDYELTSH